MVKDNHIAVARFSALGDVFMLFSVLEDAAFQDSSVSFTLFTRPHIASLLPVVKGIRVIGLDISGDYKSWISQLSFYWGWYRSNTPKFVFDAHSHLRTAVFYFLAFLMGYRVKRLPKNRGLRRAFLKKNIKSLPSIQSEISQVLQSFGVKYRTKMFALKSRDNSFLGEKKSWIICPFTSKKTKNWPLDKAIKVIDEILNEGNSIIVFGSKKELENWNYFPARLTLSSNMEMSEKDMWLKAKGAIVCDSANQHIAASYNVLSVVLWMGTSPKAGFKALNNNSGSIDVEYDGLECRPCSISGVNYCSRKDFACKNIPTEKILSAVKDLSK